MARRGLAAALLAVGCASSPPPGPAGAPAPKGGAEPFAPNDVIAYRIKDAAGKVVGRAHSTYLRPGPGEQQVLTRIQLDDGPSAGLRVEHATTLRDDHTPVSYKRLSSVEGRYELKFVRDGVDVITNEHVSKVRRDLVRTVVVPRDDLMLVSLVLHAERLGEGETRIVDVFRPELLKSEPWSVKVWRDATKGRVAEIPAGQVVLDDSGRVNSLAGDGLVFEREDPPGDPPRVTYQAPRGYTRPAGARFDDRPITIATKLGALSGVLSVPKDRGRHPKGLAPVVVFLSDRRAEDRNGFAGAIDTGTWEWMDRLAEDGTAVLRVDDRGVGASTNEAPAGELGLFLLAEDGRAMLRALETQADVDPARVILVGHGTGGLAALLVAAEVELAGLALIGTPFRRLVELTFADVADDLERERLVRLGLLALGGNGQATAQLSPAKLAELEASRAMILDRERIDLKGLAGKLGAPIALFQGLADIEVSWKLDAGPLKELLEKGPGRGKVKLFAYDRTDHLMKAEAKTSSLERYADASRRLETRFLEDLTKWVRELTGG